MFPYIDLGFYKLPVYGLCMAAGIFLSLFAAARLGKKRGVTWDNLAVICVCAVLLGIIGAKLLYFITLGWDEVKEIFRREGIMALINSGLVFYGGLIAGVAGYFLGLRLVKGHHRDYEAAAISVVPLAHAFGRLGCFCAGCCYGVPTDSHLGVVYTHPIGGAPVGIKLFPVQLLEAFCLLILFGLLVFLNKKQERLCLPVYLICYAVIRFIIEKFRFDEIRGVYGPFSTSQWISFAILAAGLVILALRLTRRKKQGSEEIPAREDFPAEEQ